MRKALLILLAVCLCGCAATHSDEEEFESFSSTEVTEFFGNPDIIPQARDGKYLTESELNAAVKNLVHYTLDRIPDSNSLKTGSGYSITYNEGGVTLYAEPLSNPTDLYKKGISSAESVDNFFISIDDYEFSGCIYIDKYNIISFESTGKLSDAHYVLCVMAKLMGSDITKVFTK